MESNQSLTNNTRFETDVIAGFRSFFMGMDNATELPYVKLVSRHDESILFTNSTTSVMKPRLLDGLNSNSIIYLAQPAMGTQGLAYWQRSGSFGPFASYFTSLGAVYHPNSYELALQSAFEIMDTWGYDRERIGVAANISDLDLIDVAYDACSRVTTDRSAIPYRHTYGVSGMSGRNLNLIRLDGPAADAVIGNVTLIEMCNQPIASEVSFDSTTLAMVVHGLSHAVQAHFSGGYPFVEEDIAARDFSTTLAPLLLEGVAPKSRGRGGIMRNFLRSYLGQRRMKGWSYTEAFDELHATCEAELMMRQYSMFTTLPSPEISISNAERVIEEWMPKIAEEVGLA